MIRVVLSIAACLPIATFAQYCPDPVDYEGNFYCSQVEAVTYTGVGGHGSYDKITYMDAVSGACTSQPFGYSGSLSPLNEEVSLHVRGPFRLLRFAAYTPGRPSAKRASHTVQGHGLRNVRGHAHLHHEARDINDRAVGDWVTATINGQVVSWVNEYSPAPAIKSPKDKPVIVAPTHRPVPETGSQPAAQVTEEALPRSWGRRAFYHAGKAQAQGLVFLNHFGGTGSGVFDYTFGSSLSYASADGTTGCNGSELLEDITLPSGAEIVIMSDCECGEGDRSCGYHRPGTVAYHGFEGPDKAFFFEFEMPNDGKSGGDAYDPVNMPAIWMLNAQIPRTLQYGESTCSCWSSGCGEFDIFEVLTPGYNRAKSTLHGNIAGGSSDWLPRPESGPIQLGVVMVDDRIHVKILNRSIAFGNHQAGSLIQHIVDSTTAQSDTVSVFSLRGATFD